MFSRMISDDGRWIAVTRGTDGRVASVADSTGRLVAYTSTQAHSSVEKAVKIAGLGRANLRLVEVDERFAMRPDALMGEAKTYGFGLPSLSFALGSPASSDAT